MGSETIPLTNAAEGKQVSLYSGPQRITRSASITTTVLGVSVPRNFWRIVFASLFSMSSSLLAVLCNSSLFKDYKFPPLSAQPVLMIGGVFVSILLGIFASCCKKFPNGKPFWPRFSIDLKTAIALLPLAMTFIPRIYYTNAALGTIQLSTYQIFRQTAILFSVLLSWAILRMRPSCGVLASCMIVLCGCLIVKIDGSSNIQLDGVYYGTMAGCFSALYMVVVKYFLPKVNNDPEVLLNYNSFLSSLMLVPIVLISRDYKNLYPFFPWMEGCHKDYLRIWGILMLSVFSGFLISISSMMLVKEASPVTYDVIGVSKGAIQSVIGIIFKGDSRTIGNLLGNILALVGSFAYGKAKHLEHLKHVKEDTEAKKRASLAKRQMSAFADKSG